VPAKCNIVDVVRLCVEGGGCAISLFVTTLFSDADASLFDITDKIILRVQPREPQEAAIIRTNTAKEPIDRDENVYFPRCSLPPTKTVVEPRLEPQCETGIQGGPKK